MHGVALQEAGTAVEPPALQVALLTSGGTSGGEVTSTVNPADQPLEPVEVPAGKVHVTSDGKTGATHPAGRGEAGSGVRPFCKSIVKLNGTNNVCREVEFGSVTLTPYGVVSPGLNVPGGSRIFAAS